MNHTYIIGGSPCSGKSTIAEILSKKYDLYYFKVDDFLDAYIKAGAAKGYPVCSRIEAMNPEQTWMRDPHVQCDEELAFYEEVFEFILEDIKKLGKKAVITEGAAYLPKLMKRHSIPQDKYISVTPAKEFQVFHYSKREWVPYILEGCSDKNKAFSNWMERDALFAKEVQRQCQQEDYVSIINNGTLPIEELVNKVSLQLHLS